MIYIKSEESASEYYCTKNIKHHEISMSGQKKRCWQCGAKMNERKNPMVVVKNAKRKA